MYRRWRQVTFIYSSMVMIDHNKTSIFVNACSTCTCMTWILCVTRTAFELVQCHYD